MIDVLEPFKVWTGNTTTICKKIWDNDDSLICKILFGGKSCWTISSFENGLALKSFAVSFMNTLLKCCGKKVVNLLFHIAKWITNLNLFCSFISNKWFVLYQMLFSIFNIDSVWVINWSLFFDYVSDFSTILFNKFGSPISYVTESLDTECFIFDT